MKTYKLTRDEAECKYGKHVAKTILKGAKSIDVTGKQMVILERWKLVKEKAICPFHYEYVYLIAGGPDVFKIGITTRPSSRLSSLQTGSPIDLTFMGAMLVTQRKARTIERALHTQLKKEDRWKKGEWFSGDPSKTLAWMRQWAEALYPANVISNPRSLLAGNDEMAAMWLVMHGRDGMETYRINDMRREYLWFLENDA